MRAPEPRKSVMADDDFDDDEPELELDDEVDLEDDELELDDAVEEDVLEVLDDAVDPPAIPPTKVEGAETAEEDDDDGVDLEEELHPDDVEEPLDVLLAERIAAERLDEEEADLEDEDLEPDDRTEGSGRILPRRDDEFLCRSCFLVKPLSQLAKGEKDLCRDCE